MRLFQKIPFTFEGKDYEIRVHFDDRAVNVAAFLNNRPADGYRYQVQIPKNRDVGKILKGHGFDELVEACKKNITDKWWGTLAKTIAEASIPA